MKDEKTNKNQEENSTSNQKATDVVLDKSMEAFKWWNNLATLNKEDSIPMSMVKIGIRIVGVIVLIALSPIAIIAVMIAFLTVL